MASDPIRLLTAALALAGSVGISAPAAAGKYQQVCAQATRVDGVEAIAALLFTATVACDKETDDLARRQCVGIRDARTKAVAGETFVLYSDAASVQVGDYNEKKQGAPIALHGCIACAKPLDVAGQPRYVTTRGAVTVEGGALVGPKVHEVLRPFVNKTLFRKWKEIVLPRLRTELIVRMPERPTAWQEDEAQGFAFELIGFRVYDPCDGQMIAANPASDAEKADRKNCKGGLVGSEEPKVAIPVEPVVEAPRVPEKLSPSAVKRSMQQIAPAVNACFAIYGVPGKADVSFEIGSDGKVRRVALSSEDFEDTPTGTCILDAVKSAEFPEFLAPSMTVNYPFILR